MMSIIGQIKKTPFFLLSVSNILMVYGFITFPFIKHIKTALWGLFVLLYTNFGITGGVHRLWCHRSYKANLPLRLLLAGGYYTSFQMPLLKWVRFHRLHHKNSDTNADPHNVNRGFLFCHLGWIVLNSVPEVKEKLYKVDMSDLETDSVAVIGDKYYYAVGNLLQLLSMAVPVYFWNEEWYYAVLIQVMRWMVMIHISASVNSFAHLWGYKPYDRNICAVDNPLIAYISLGEGWHNYHHTFPYDYRMSEFSGFIKFDPTTLLIRFFENIGWAYDLKTVSDSVIRMTVSKRGNEKLVKPF